MDNSPDPGHAQPTAYNSDANCSLASTVGSNPNQDSFGCMAGVVVACYTGSDTNSAISASGSNFCFMIAAWILFKPAVPIRYHK
jgi:hypothetical protein